MRFKPNFTCRRNTTHSTAFPWPNRGLLLRKLRTGYSWTPNITQMPTRASACEGWSAGHEKPSDRIFCKRLPTPTVCCLHHHHPKNPKCTLKAQNSNFCLDHMIYQILSRKHLMFSPRPRPFPRCLLISGPILYDILFAAFKVYYTFLSPTTCSVCTRNFSIF